MLAWLYPRSSSPSTQSTILEAAQNVPVQLSGSAVLRDAFLVNARRDINSTFEIWTLRDGDLSLDLQARVHMYLTLDPTAPVIILDGRGTDGLTFCGCFADMVHSTAYA